MHTVEIIKVPLFPSILPNKEIGKAAVVTSIRHWVRRRVGSQLRWAGTWGERRGGSQSIAVDVGGHSGLERGVGRRRSSYSRSQWALGRRGGTIGTWWRPQARARLVTPYGRWSHANTKFKTKHTLK